MAYDQTVLERLERELNERDVKIEELQEQIAEMKAHATWGWSRHTSIDAADDPLPVPRLQIEVFNTSGDWHIAEWVYSMAYAHLLGHHVVVPLGHTRQTSGRGWHRDVSDLPLRDGAHIRHDAKAFGWPAFAICEGHATLIEVEGAAPC